MTSFPQTDIAIIGAGIVGLSTTATLIKRGYDVHCFESARPGGAQSAGGSRILRFSYEDPGMLALAKDAVEGWKKWEALSGEIFLEDDRSLLVVPDARAEIRHLHNCGLDAEILPPSEQNLLLPIRKGWDRPVILEKDAGTLHAADVVYWLRQLAGPRLHEESEVIGLTPRGDHVLVTTRDAIWRAERVLICAGASTPVLASWLGITIPQVHSVHQRLLIKIRPEFRNLRLPSFRDKTHHRDGVLHSCGLRALHHDRYAIGLEPANVERVGGGHPDIVVEHTLDYVRDLFPGLDPGDVLIESCVSTALAAPASGVPWESERLLVHREGNCDIFAGGHLFKFAPSLAELLADVSSGGPVPSLLQP